MLPFRQIAAFFIRLLVIYGLLLILWPGVKPTYAGIFSAQGNLVFRSLIPRGPVYLRPMVPPSAGVFDTEIHLLNLRSGAGGMIPASSRRAYAQTILLVSLVLATPLPWWRRFTALVWGLILVDVAITCKLFVAVLHGFSDSHVRLLVPAPPWDRILPLANQLVANDIVTLFIVPVFIWILVTFRRTDWAEFAHGR